MSKKKMNLFYIVKLNTSRIINSDYYLEMDFKNAKNNGEIISLGDNQVLRFIRRIKEKEFDIEEVSNLYKERNELKQAKDNLKLQKIIRIQNKINELLYVSDLVTVKTDTTKKDYKSICKNGFTISMTINNNTYKVKYKRLCAGAGQLRRNSALFVNEKLYDMLEQIMMCGLTRQKIGKINLAKFSAYFSLFTSATNQVSTPRICVVKDFEYDLKNQIVDWIYQTSDGTYEIEKRKIDFPMNAFDGSGMICPNMAKKWQEDLSLDYLPSSFIIRSAWIKGLVSVFDFHKFAKEVAKVDKIKDTYGQEYNIEDIDIILTTSQFKMFKKYQNWQQYLYYHKKYNHIFGVTRVNKKKSDFVTPLNYQYIQSNNFTEESIKNIARPTLDWLVSILNGDPLYTSLLLVGCHDIDTSIEDIESGLDSTIAKCLLYNHEILKDDYIKRKIYSIIEAKINQAKIGKLYVEGSYDFIIPDLYAMAEHAFGMEVHGLLPAKYMYSRRWMEKGTKTVSIQRSPLVAPAENQLMNIYYDDKCKEWFQYIEWGNVVNIWDLTAISMSDADYDKI